MNKKTRGYLILITLIILLGSIFFVSVLNIKNKRDPSLSYRKMLIEAFSESRIDEIIPSDWPPGKPYWITKDEYPDLSIILFSWDLYAVKVNDEGKPLSIDGEKRLGVSGILGIPYTDREINYSESDRSVRTYNVENGVNSGGDIIVVFEN